VSFLESLLTAHLSTWREEWGLALWEESCLAFSILLNLKQVDPFTQFLDLFSDPQFFLFLLFDVDDLQLLHISSYPLDLFFKFIQSLSRLRLLFLLKLLWDHFICNLLDLLYIDLNFSSWCIGVLHIRCSLLDSCSLLWQPLMNLLEQSELFMCFQFKCFVLWFKILYFFLQSLCHQFKVSFVSSITTDNLLDVWT
jgi:hypothetical protein